jgi:hypothetical protein
MGEWAAAARPVGWPGDVRGGIFDGPMGREYRAFGGTMLESFEHMLDLNRPIQPRSSDLLAGGFPKGIARALPVEVGHWGVRDG